MSDQCGGGHTSKLVQRENRAVFCRVHLPLKCESIPNVLGPHGSRAWMTEQAPPTDPAPLQAQRAQRRPVSCRGWEASAP